MKNFAKPLWIGISFFILVVTVFFYDGKSFSDIWILLTWFMLIASFPGGLLVSGVHYVLAEFSITIETSYFSLVLEWVVYFILGYIQWFVLLPWLWRKWNTRGKVT